MVGAAQGVLDVAENRIHPSKLGALDSGFSATHHHRLMNAAGRGDAMKAGQPIGDDPSACTEVELRPGGDFGETEWDGTGPLRERLFTAVWDNLQYVGELGSLVQVRESVAQLAACSMSGWMPRRARRGSLDSRVIRKLFRRPVEGQLELGSILTDADRERVRQLELERKVLEDEAQQLKAELLVAIEAAAASATENPSDRIFAEDTARGLKLLQVLSRKYDIVVMNPPYGAFVPAVTDFVKAAYPLTSNDIYAAFIDRSTQLTEPEGYVGALVSATFVNLKSFEKLRTQILLKRNALVTMLDLGFGILDDATVEAAAIVLRGGAR